MNFQPGYLVGMILQSVPEPRKIAREIFAADIPRARLWEMLLLLLVLSTALAVVDRLLFPVDVSEIGLIFASPLLLGLSEAIASGLMVFAIHVVGRMAGGIGQFDEALKTVIWIHFVTLVIQVLVMVFGLVAPGFALMLVLVGSVLSLWILTHFVTELHGFRSAGLVFVGIILTFFVAIFMLSIVATLVSVVFGLEGAITNV